MTIPHPDIWASLPTSRADARQLGASHYMRATPCSRGHTAPRRTADGVCTDCAREAQRRRRANRIFEVGTEAFYEEQRERERNRPSSKPEAHAAYVRDRRRKGVHPEQLQRLMTPPWLGTSERMAIRGFYANRPEGMTVDHIVPFLHDRQEVVGLHVLANLQYLTSRENIRIKGNRLPEGLTAEMAVKKGIAVRRRDVDFEAGTVNWEPYR